MAVGSLQKVEMLGSHNSLYIMLDPFSLGLIPVSSCTRRVLLWYENVLIRGSESEPLSSGAQEKHVHFIKS